MPSSLNLVMTAINSNTKISITSTFLLIGRKIEWTAVFEDLCMTHSGPLLYSELHLSREMLCTLNLCNVHAHSQILMRLTGIASKRFLGTLDTSTSDFCLHKYKQDLSSIMLAVTCIT